MRDEITAAEAAEELQLWADYYEATARALEIMRAEGTTTATLVRIAAEDAKAAAAIERIKAIRGIDRDSSSGPY
jgi:cytosine/adenosine deaminase-related metal-dependent hydrolase